MGQDQQILDFKEWHLHECHQSALIQVISQTGVDKLQLYCCSPKNQRFIWPICHFRFRNYGQLGSKIILNILLSTSTLIVLSHNDRRVHVLIINRQSFVYGINQDPTKDVERFNMGLLGPYQDVLTPKEFVSGVYWFLWTSMILKRSIGFFAHSITANPYLLTL